MPKDLPRFHLAFPVDDLGKAIDFYAGTLGCPRGRSSASWADFDLGGHQIVAHLASSAATDATNDVDGKNIPVRHFGLVLEKADWERYLERIKKTGIAFRVEPHIRFEGTNGEQGTFFVDDPAGNSLEFKFFADQKNLFAK